MEWAKVNADKDTYARYLEHGQKLRMVDDRQTINGGEWEFFEMTYTENKQTGTMDASSLAYVMTDKFPVESFAGDHYCKLVSPFKAMEWIYVDSLYAKFGMKETDAAETETTNFLQ